MSVVFSGTNQGTFISTGQGIYLPIRSNVDWMYTYNYTQLGMQNADTVVQAYWQRGMPQAGGLAYEKQTGASDVLSVTTFGNGLGFSLYDNTINTPQPLIALTSISNATPPRVLVGSTAGLTTGDVVRIFSTTGAQQLGSVDFTITVIDGTHFDLEYMAGIVAAAGPGNFRVIPYSPYFYPPTRVISKISNNLPQAIVTLTVDHNFTIGQVVRFTIPTINAASFGMTQLNNVQATIVAVNQADANGITNTITVDVNTTTFTPFAWPLTANPAFTYPQVTPVGMNTAASIAFNTNIIGDSEVNQGAIGMYLGGGASSPSGVNGDLIYWVAGKSYQGGV